MAELILLSTPIGNLGDLTENALNILKSEKYFLAEDTRNLSKLLDHLDIDKSNKSFRSFHEHNQNETDSIISWIKNNHKVVLVSDAGSPIVSDPGYPLVVACYNNDIKVSSAPGVSSVIVALERSALPPIPFHFHGFLPRENNKINQSIETSLAQKGTHIYFESPHRIMKTIDQILTYETIDQIVLGRELTKKFEEIIFINKTNWNELKSSFIKKGEFVLMYSVIDVEIKGNSNLKVLAEKYLDKPSTKQLSKLLAEILEENSKDIYQKLHN